jgi:hypothetical protein
VLLIFIDLGWFEPAILGSNGKHTNHYTTEDDMFLDDLVHLGMLTELPCI